MDTVSWIRTQALSPWQLSRVALVELHNHLERTQPQTVVEFGSGVSTFVLADYAQRHPGVSVHSHEHDRRFLLRTRRRLGQRATAIHLTHAPLRMVDGHPVYTAKLPSGIDFALIDGPPEGLGGRMNTFPQLTEHLNPLGEVWLDDGHRPGEQEALEVWRSLFDGFTFEETTVPRNLTRISRWRESMREVEIDASDITITILTGRRAHLLERTLSSLPKTMLETCARVVLLNNGGDAETQRVADHWLAPRDVYLETDDFLPMGLALAHLNEHIHTNLMFHLEDDWDYATFEDTWLDDAREALEDQQVFQVRCRHAGEKTRANHMVTRRKIRWQPCRQGLVADDAHFTTNPCLIRTRDWTKLWPCAGEQTAMRAAWNDGLRKVVQLAPGAFVHTGENDSLREITGG